ncbi:MAG: DUF2797 domain-containing protein [Bacteroidota bacterium]|nr:DUF2797 domain-containing protein [Bacteroidota bacterium]
MEYTGNIRKMEAFPEKVIQYFLPVGKQKINMNELIGTPITMEYQGQIHCIKCGRETRKSFAQGYCYPCFTTAPETEECVLRPELCRAHEGVARDMDYAKHHCLSDQVVYLSLTSGIKVGVTRISQVPTRWIDQGAIRAIEFARTPNRFTAGLMEVALKDHIPDKTNWRKMLSGSDPGEVDLPMEKHRLAALVPQDLAPYITKDDQLVELEYPVLHYPEKIKSLNFDKDPLVSGVITGIKGQYLLLDQKRVINMRKFGGYLIRFRTGN